MIWEVGGEIRRLPASIETPACRLRCLYASPANQYSCPIQHVLSSIQLVVLGR